MSRNQCLARLIGRLVFRLHQILSKPLRTKSTAVTAATYASWPPWTEPLSPPPRSPLGGKVAPQGLGGLSRNTEPSSTGLQADKTLDWKMCMIEHCLICIFVYLSPPLEYMLPEIWPCLSTSKWHPYHLEHRWCSINMHWMNMRSLV